MGSSWLRPNHLAHQASLDHGGIRRWRCHRRADSLLHRADPKAPSRDRVRHRVQAWRRRQHCGGRCRPHERRWASVPDDRILDPGGQRQLVQNPPIRSGKGFRADRLHGHRALHPGGQPRARAGQHVSGVRRLRQIQAGPVELRQFGDHRKARWRDSQAAHGIAGDLRAVQDLGPGGFRHHRRPS